MVTEDISSRSLSVTNSTISDNYNNDSENLDEYCSSTSTSSTTSTTSTIPTTPTTPITDELAITLQDNDNINQVPSFGHISVANSSDIHFGNKTFYQGPVTIKQFLYTDSNGKPIDYKINKEILLNPDTVTNDYDNKTHVTDTTDNRNNLNKILDENELNVIKGCKIFEKFIKQNYILFVSILSLLIVSLGIWLIITLIKHNSIQKGNNYDFNQDTNEQDKSSPQETPLDNSLNLILPDKLKINNRQEWLAQPPVKEATPLQLPVPYVIIMHTATENCSSQAQCRFHVRYIQMFHIESRNWWDIGYNFLVGGDGEAYEGRGWKSEGAHTFGYNSRSIGIAFIGTFNLIKPSNRQLIACKKLIEEGVKLGYIAKDYKLLGAKQLQSTQSPGALLFKEIMVWNHWAKEP